ncbi:MFS transporter [Neobacillus kokaensis]|uniref:MFS transporter n=1 Tax=Neobacillus kokaensis TaxID=2759023 RepID=A0ABQ3N9X5_9BACI|nr:MFS transporter [Neobacillus kokaensis]GHH99640.1 MFS transporter [Neobacillus kokaensis]
MAQVDVQYTKPIHFALQSRMFSLFMSGSFLTRVGDWMDITALNWVVLQFTNSPLHLALINGCRLLPAFLFSVPAGILADRYDRRRLLIFIQIGMMLFTFCLAYLVEMRQSYWLFVFIVTIRSILAAMDPPIRNALVPNLVPQTALISAIAINTTIIHLSRMIGPAVAGMLLAVTDLEDLFYINAWGTLGVILSLHIIRPNPSLETIKKEREKATFREVAAFVKSTPPVQALFLLAIVPMVFGFPYTTMMPLFTRDLLHLGSEGFGLLLSISSVGALGGTVWLSIRKEVKGAGRWLVYSIIGFGFSLLLFIGSTNIITAGAAMFLVGLTSQTYRTMSRITLQIHVPDQLRGRILSIALMDRGFIPLGAILIGAVASVTGTLSAGILMGAGCIVTTILIVVGRRQIWNL